MSNKIKMINSVFEVWSNLENAYENKGIEKGQTKSEFFKSLVGYNDGRHSLNVLLMKLNSAISDDSVRQDEELLDKYSKLAETFKILGKYIESNGIPSVIDNLDLFLMDSMGLLKEEYTKEDLLDSFNYNPKNDSSINKYHHRVMLEEFGCLLEHIEVDKNGTIHHYIGVESKKDKFRFFTSDMMYNYLVNGYGSKEYMSDSFNIDCLTILALLIRESETPSRFFISDKSNIVDNKLFGIGELRFVRQTSHEFYSLVEYKCKELSIYCLY